ncbi:MAG: aldo/keto reductase [Phycisphaeraceae bacterium]
MEMRQLGQTGLWVTPLGFGAAPMAFLDKPQEQADATLNRVLDAGVNLIDTAACYPNSEQVIGRAVGHRRDDYVLASKCGHLAHGLRGREWSAELIARSIDRSLTLLRTDHLDIMLLHSCDLAVLKQGEALEALRQAREAGKVRHIGYSGDNEAAAYAAGLEDVEIIQTSVSICDQTNIDLVLPVAEGRNLGVIAKRPLANAAWKNLAEQPGMYAHYAAEYNRRLRRMNLTPSDLGFDDGTGAAWLEMSLRFTLSQPQVHAAIVGTTCIDHLEANVYAAGLGALPPIAVQKVRNAFHRAQNGAGYGWVAQT